MGNERKGCKPDALEVRSSTAKRGPRDWTRDPYASLHMSINDDPGSNMYRFRADL